MMFYMLSYGLGCVMFNATFNDISFVLIVAVVLTEETVVFAEKHKSLTNFIT